VAVTAAAIVAILAVLLGRPGTSGGGRVTAAEAAFIAASVQRTLAQGTAQFTITGTTLITGPTKKFRVSDTDHGTGAADLRTGSYSTTAIVRPTSGEAVPGTDRLIGTTIYDQTGHLPWVRISETAKEVRSIDPFADLPFFARQAASVDSLGGKTIGGVSCTGFTLRVPAASYTAVTIWIDSHHLIREIDLSVRLRVVEGVNQITRLQRVLTITRYGATVHIAPPAHSRDLTSFS